MTRAVTCAVLMMTIVACSEPLEFADWTIEVPAGTPIIEYAAVPIEERAERIELVEDLVIGGSGDDPRYSFYRPRSIAVDDAGNIYVADAGDHQVKVFDSAGTHVRFLGREGQGPGEFKGPLSVTMAGGQLVVADVGRMSFWSIDGKYLAQTTMAAQPGTMIGHDDGTVFTRDVGLDESGRQLAVFARWNREGKELTRYPELLDFQPLYYPSREAEGRIGLTVAAAIPTFAAGR